MAHRGGKGDQAPKMCGPDCYRGELLKAAFEARILVRRPLASEHNARQNFRSDRWLLARAPFSDFVKLGLLGHA